MAVNQNRRRKKIEAQKAKKKEKQRAISRIESSSKIIQMTKAASWPVIDSFMSGDLKGQGITSVFLARRGPHGQVAFAVFLVDAYCLGVKDAFGRFESEPSWKAFKEERREGMYGIESMSPEAARKLVEQAVQYARSVGIEPHRDYAGAAAIFGDIDAAKCSTEFTFGVDGKPRFVNGPHDTPERVKKILGILEDHVGQGKYDVVLMSGQSFGDNEFEMDDNDDEYDDDEFDDPTGVIEVDAKRLD